MLNEMINLRFICPLCGKPIDHFINGYWCPFCGNELYHSEEDETIPPKRLTSRDDEGYAVYIGEKSFRPFEYAPRLSQSAMIEILERLCKWEEGKYDTE